MKLVFLGIELNRTVNEFRRACKLLETADMQPFAEKGLEAKKQPKTGQNGTMLGSAGFMRLTASWIRSCYEPASHSTIWKKTGPSRSVQYFATAGVQVRQGCQQAEVVKRRPHFRSGLRHSREITRVCSPRVIHHGTGMMHLDAEKRPDSQ
jgi:hypothetical protein